MNYDDINDLDINEENIWDLVDSIENEIDKKPDNF